jgi:hypothetical protein
MKRLLAVLLLAAACSSSGASATFSGAVRGQSLTPTASISAPATVAFTSGSAPVAAIALSDAPALCRLLGLNQEPKSSRALLIFLADVNGATGAIEVPAGTATYSVFVVGSGNPPAHFAVASFGVNDAACHRIAAQSAAAVSGAITLTGNSGGAYAGSFDLTFDSGDRVTGAFDTAVCHGLATFLARNSHSCG